MTRLDKLPIELLLPITEYLTNQRDINAFVQTNRNLYHRLHFFLCRYNVQHHQSSALLWAARNGQAGLVTKLLDAGANIAAFESPAETKHDENTSLLEIENPLLLAAQAGHITTLKSMLSETRPGRACSPAQLRTVLHWAIRSRDGDLTELMIENKAPLDPAGDDWSALSALGVAVASHYDSIIPRLLEKGAQSGPRESPCPLEKAIRTDQRQVVELLLKNGIQLKDDEGLCHIAGQNNEHLLQLLIDHGLEIEIWGHAALFTAIMRGQYKMVELLIEKGLAIYCGHLDILKLLLAKGVHPEQHDLRLAMKRGYKEEVALLSEFSYEGLPAKEDMHSYTRWLACERWEKDPEFKMMETQSFLDVLV